MGPIVLLVKNWMGPNVQSGKTRWDQTSNLAKMAWDQMSMGPIVRLPAHYYTKQTHMLNGIQYEGCSMYNETALITFTFYKVQRHKYYKH